MIHLPFLPSSLSLAPFILSAGFSQAGKLWAWALSCVIIHSPACNASHWSKQRDRRTADFAFGHHPVTSPLFLPLLISFVHHIISYLSACLLFFQGRHWIRPLSFSFHHPLSFISSASPPMWLPPLSAPLAPSLSLLLGLRAIPLSAISLSGGKHWGRCSFDGLACGN